MSEKKIADIQNGELSIENALEKLEAIVGRMESGKLPLEDMIRDFEAGSKLSLYCEKKLQALEKRIEILVSAPQDAEKWESFDEDTSKTPAASKASSAKAKKNADIGSQPAREDDPESLPF